MIYAGLDEAALGAKLGPFCSCLTHFEYSGPRMTELYEILTEVICQTKDSSGRLQIADSKTVFFQSGGIKNLETGVLALLGVAGISPPLSFFHLLQFLCPNSDLRALTETPWFAGSSDLSIPISQSTYHEFVPAISVAMKNCSITMKCPKLRFISAREFNRELERHEGKSPAIQSIIAPLLISILEDNKADTRVSVDRQGGRRYYGTWLRNIFPNRKIETILEESKCSRYRIGNASIEFLVRADSTKLETALASMISKYIREVAMLLFNAWWRKRLPGIRPCAGYPLDAKRFLQEIKDAGVVDEWYLTLVRHR